MQDTTRIRALCCECGNLRTVAANHRGPRDANRTDETSDRDGRGWRCTVTLKCSACGTKTRHALLRGDDDPRPGSPALLGVPLPAGARVMEDWDTHSRIIGTDVRDVAGTNTGVKILGCQLPDGSLDTTPGDQVLIHVETRCDIPQFKGWSDRGVMTAEGARQLSRVLLEAADQLDGWTSVDR